MPYLWLCSRSNSYEDWAMDENWCWEYAELIQRIFSSLYSTVYTSLVPVRTGALPLLFRQEWNSRRSQLSSPQHDCVRYHHHHTITDGSNWQTLFLQYTAKSDRQRLRSNCYSMRDSTFKILIDCLRIPKESIVHV